MKVLFSWKEAVANNIVVTQSYKVEYPDNYNPAYQFVTAVFMNSVVEVRITAHYPAQKTVLLVTSLKVTYMIGVKKEIETYEYIVDVSHLASWVFPD